MSNETGNAKDYEVNAWKELTIIFIFILFGVFYSSSVQPKLSIDTPAKQELLEYQRSTEEVLIETPAPRTEKLEGFSPLKKD